MGGVLMDDASVPMQAWFQGAMAVGLLTMLCVMQNVPDWNQFRRKRPLEHSQPTRVDAARGIRDGQEPACGWDPERA